MAIDLKHMAWGSKWNKLCTIGGGIIGAVVGLGQYLDLIPEQYRSQKWYGVVAAIIALGVAISPTKKPAPDPVPVAPEAKPLPLDKPKGFVRLSILLGALSLAFLAAPTCARADAPSRLPATLCLIGVDGNWCYGILPSVTAGFGVDIRHGEVKPSVNIGASIAATWMPGQLKSLTLGLRSGFNGGTAGQARTWNVGGTFSFLKGYATLILDWEAVGGDHAFVLAPAFSAAF